MKDLLREIWIPLVLLIIVIGVQILLHIPCNIQAVIVGGIGGVIGTLLYHWKNK